MNSSSHSRRARELTAYAATAAATLAAHPAIAAIEFTDLGPGGLALPDTFTIDLNNDGAAEFVLKNEFFGGVGTCTPTDGHCWHTGNQSLDATGFAGNEILTTANGYVGRALPAGFEIGTSFDGDRDAELAFAFFRWHHGPSSSSSYGGEFFFKRAYLGLAFDLSDGRHAGWAEIGVTADDFPRGHFDATIYGFAYDTTPGATIAAGAVPEPPALVLLAAGAAGITALRSVRAGKR